MQTLGKAITRSFFRDERGYHTLETHWRSLVNSDARFHLGPQHHLLYQALRGKDWRRGFAPITNQRKLDNGAFYGWGLRRALNRIHSSWSQESLLAPFGGLVDEATLCRLRELLPKNIRDLDFDAYEETSDV